MICNLCPRKCSALRDNNNASGFCKCNDTMKVARIAPHMWEEPCLSGTHGSGAVFFSGCTLKCVYCQNYPISHENKGKYISERQLADKLRELEGLGVHTIEFISGTQYVNNIIRTLEIYRPKVPLVYNCSGYENTDTLKMLNGYIDVYLPDFKYSDDSLALRLSNCKDYTNTTTNAIKEMLNQQPTLNFTDEGIIKNGVIIRHLVLPNHIRNSVGVLEIIKENFDDKVLVSLMGQYIPYANAKSFDDINRKITKREYNKVLDKLMQLDLDGFSQELESADASFIPQWDY